MEKKVVVAAADTFRAASSRTIRNLGKKIWS